MRALRLGLVSGRPAVGLELVVDRKRWYRIPLPQLLETILPIKRRGQLNKTLHWSRPFACQLKLRSFTQMTQYLRGFQKDQGLDVRFGCEVQPPLYAAIDAPGA
jgi:hypothetical protein